MMDPYEDLRERLAAAALQRPVSEHTPHSARELLVGSLGSDPWRSIERLREAGERRAQAVGVCTQLEHERKIILKRVASEYAREHPKYSEAKLDRLARADERYANHIRGLAAATEEKSHSESEYWAIRSELEWDQKAIAHLNQVARLGEP